MYTWKNGDVLNANTLNEAQAQIANEIFYKAGDKISLTNFYGGGFLTTGSTQVQFSVPLPKLLKNIKNINITKLIVYIRHVDGGYLFNGDDLVQLENVTLTSANSNNYISITATANTAFSGLKNNSPLGIQIRTLEAQLT